jgi:hypothetical protein
MPTVFLLCAPNSKDIDLHLDRLQAMLPQTMSLDTRTDGLYVTVASQGNEDQLTQPLINRELDRVFFLTSVRVKAEMIRRSVRATVRLAWSVHGELPAGKEPQVWTETTALQLRLWALASDAEDLSMRVILYFQIIELSFPDTNDTTVYPPYKDASIPPHPRTESKLLRHLVAHAGTPRPETLAYLRHLGLPKMLSNHVSAEWEPKLSSRLAILEGEARGVVRSAV